MTDTTSTEQSVELYRCPQPGCTFKLRSASPALLERLTRAHRERRHAAAPAGTEHSTRR